MKARILLVASEALPFAKTGGLADVITPLARALARRGIRTSLLLPGYPSALAQARGAREVAALSDLPGGPGRLLLTEDAGVTVLLLATARFAGREGLYADPDGRDYADNALRFADLAHAADRICAGLTPLAAPHVVHLHDWHTALVPMIQRSLARPQPTPSVLTLHNLAFQGTFPMEVAGELGLGDGVACRRDAEFWGRFSFLKAGIRHADRLTTVSRSYAQEILTPTFGCGLDGVLRERAADLAAIANGIDPECWSPRHDGSIAAAFSSADLDGKAVCKAALQVAFGLPVDAHAPLMALGSRLTHQKMADVALQALPQLLERHARLQVVVHGCGEHEYEQGFTALAAGFEARVGVRLGYQERLAHALHAGADLLLHGSRFEPFGLTPLYAMRYGTLPIASNVGGLRDTVVDAGDADTPNPRGTGVLFDGEGARDMIEAVDRGLRLTANARLRRILQRNGMARDFDWNRQAEAYVALYREIVSDRVRFDAPTPSSDVRHTTQASNDAAAFAQAAKRRTAARP